MVGAREADPDFYNALIARVKRLRENRYPGHQGMVQIADLLGVQFETYKKYEMRTPIPIHLMDHFAALVGVSLEYLITERK